MNNDDNININTMNTVIHHCIAWIINGQRQGLLSFAGESLGQALDRAFAERIRLPEGDTVHAGAPIQDTRAAPIPGPPSPPDAKGKSGANGQPGNADPGVKGQNGADGQPGKAEDGAEGDVTGPTETTAAGIAQAGHEEVETVDPSISSAADHSALPTGGDPYHIHAFQLVL